MTYICPVCGYYGLDDNPADSTYEICECCGVEFGLDDLPASNTVEVYLVGESGIEGLKAMANLSQAPKTRGEMWGLLQAKWVADGMPWCSDDLPPKGWDPRAQLREAFNKIVHPTADAPDD